MAEPQALWRLPLPHLTPPRTAAWMLSVTAHIVAAGMVVWLMHRAVVAPPVPLERMVFIEPAPPPPAPLGAPAGSPQAPVVAVAPQRAVEPATEAVKQQRLVVPRKRQHKPPPQVAVPSGESTGSVGGVAGGVPGGEAGGLEGGTVGGHGDTPVPADRVERPPLVVMRVLPAYPPVARARNLEGRVVLRAVVDREGRVEEAITVVESVPVFDASAIDALRRWRFEPGRDRGGQLVRVLVDVPIRFQLR